MGTDWSTLKKGVPELFDTFSNSFGLSIFFLIFCFFLFYLWTFSLSYKLFCVHRSKTACKKIMKNYTFWQKVALMPQKKHCLHAKNFCNKIINYFYVHTVFFIFSLIFTIAENLISTKLIISVFLLAAQFFTFVLPVFVMEMILVEKPFVRFSKYKFEKYHHTKEFEKLT